MSRSAVLGSACAVNAVLLGAAYLSLPPLFDQISRVEGWSLRQLQQAWALVPLGSGLVALATGALLTRRSDRPIAAAAGALSVVALVIQSRADSAWVFAGALLAFGIGNGALLVALTSRVARTFPDAHAGTAQAAFFGAYTLGTAVGLATAQMLASAVGEWRDVPLVWGVAASVSLVPMLGFSMEPVSPGEPGTNPSVPPSRAPLVLYGLVYALYVGGYLGIAGLLPYQLRKWGWEPTTADGVLALSTLGFLVGAFALAAATDRFGRRRATFCTSMAVAAALTACVPAVAREGGEALAAIMITAIGFACGALSLFFPIVLGDAATGGQRAVSSVGATTAASYFGGFLVPFALAPFAEEHPVEVLVGYAVAFALAGGAMVFTGCTHAGQSSD